MKRTYVKYTQDPNGGLPKKETTIVIPRLTSDDFFLKNYNPLDRETEVLKKKKMAKQKEQLKNLGILFKNL